MAEAVATTTTAVATSAHAPTSAAPAQPAAPAASQGGGKTAGQTVAASQGAHGAHGAPGAKPEQDSATSTPGADAAKQASQAAEVKQDPSKPAVSDKDEVAETMARLNREQREVSAAKKKLEASHKELGEKAKMGEALLSAREALGKKDFLGALMTLAGEAGLDADEAAVLLLEQANGREKPPLTEEQARKLASEEFEAKQKAAKEEAEKQAAANIEKGKQVYGNACVQIYKADPTKHPLLSIYGLDESAMFDWVFAEMKRNQGNAPAPVQTLEHFEGQHVANFEKAAKALGWVKAQPVQPSAPGQTPQAKDKTNQPAFQAIVPASDTEGAVSEQRQKRESVREYDRRIKAQFAARRQARP